MAEALLRTKLFVPSPRDVVVSRPRLVQALEDGLARKLVLVSAPPGFGKTTLLSEWASKSRAKIAWLSLDEDDNDPARFLAYLAAALRGALYGDEGIERAALPLPEAMREGAALLPLINEIAAHPGEICLALDDYHLISSQAAHHALVYLIDHQPEQLHIVVSARADPPLPLARLRGYGQLSELRSADLRFTPDEAAEFLNRVMGLRLDDNQVKALSSRTEGWIAGLQMAAVSMQGRKDADAFIQAFTGSHRFILDYLMEEVWQRQPERIQAFLLRTSILERLTAGLCDAVVADNAISSEEILEYLETHNLFIQSLDDERNWYRYHRLFADLLQKRLLQLYPGEIPLLNRRAGVWFEEHGLASEAIDHFLAAREYHRAAALMESAAGPLLLHSEMATLRKWLDALPGDVLDQHEDLRFYKILSLLFVSTSPGEFVEQLRRYEQSAGEQSGRVKLLRAFVALLQGEAGYAAAFIEEAGGMLGEEDTVARILADWINSAVAMIQANLDERSRQLEELFKRSQAGGNVLIAVTAIMRLAEVRYQQGRMQETEELYRRALEMTSSGKEGEYLPIASEALIGLGELYREWNRPDDARRYLDEGIRLSGSWQDTAAMDGYISLGRMLHGEGDVTGAHRAFERATTIARNFGLTDLDDYAVALIEARLWVAEGNLEAARRWALDRKLLRPDGSIQAEDEPANVMLSMQHLRKYEMLSLARLLLADGRPADALEILDPLLPEMEAQGRTRLAIEMLILKAFAHQRQGSHDRAQAALVKALSSAEPGGFVRLFLDEGAAIVPLLQKVKAENERVDLYRRRLLGALVEGQAEPAARVGREASSLAGKAEWIEPLSEREIEVLRFLASNRSVPEIAEEMVVAVSTVRSHIKNIYSKLGVHTRYQAVDRARTLDLL